MSFKKEQLIKYIIDPILKEFGFFSESGRNLALGTAAVESDFGTYLAQIGGPALGIYQMEPRTYDDIWENYLAFQPSMVRQIEKEFKAYPEGGAMLLTGNLWYATLFCRLHYLRVPEPLPAASDIEGLAQYWKTYYNTSAGKGRVEDFIEKYKLYCL